MKNKIEYYYDIMNINIHEKHGDYYFIYNNKQYMFFVCNRDIKELEAIYVLQHNLTKYHKIILNRNKNVVTIINNKNYLLIEIHDYNESTITIKDIIEAYKINNQREITILYRNDWYTLWIKKVDYILYQRKHLSKQYLILDEVLDYFLGLAENAISYINDTNSKAKKDERDELVVSHRRLSSIYKNDYYNIKDIIIDHPTRDITEYLKYLFYTGEFNYNSIDQIINSLDLSNYGFRLLFGRMLFPTNFLDLYERIINSKYKEDNIKYLIAKIYDYEKYLKLIYIIINKKTKIPNVEWLT